MQKFSNWLQRFAVRGVFWRQYLDWAIANVPVYFLPVLIWIWTIFFFFFAAPARRAVFAHLQIILPGSNRLTNYLRTWRTLYNFAWTITEGSQFKQHKSQFAYEIEGEDPLARLAAAKSAIVLTAHMGNYDLGAALFAEKFQREIRMVRAPEPHRETARHLAESLEKTGAGGVRVDYTSDTTALSFDLLHALRENEIVSIQGDRVVGDAAHSLTQLSGTMFYFPAGRSSWRKLPRRRFSRSSWCDLDIAVTKSSCASRSYASAPAPAAKKPSAPVCASGQPCWKRSSAITGTSGLRLSRRF